MVNQKIRTTMVIDKDIIKQIKRVALDKETTQTEIIKHYLQKGLEDELKETTEEKINRLMINKNEYKKNKESSIMDFAGSIHVDEPFDPVEAEKEII